MYIKLNNPSQASARTGLIFAVIFFAILFMLLPLGVLIYGSAPAVAIAVWELFLDIWKDSHFAALLCAFLIVVFPIASILSIREYLKTRRKAQDSHFIRGLDFQPNDVILVSGHPVVLAYQDTHFKLIIHIKRVQAGKNSTVPKITQLTLCFIPNGENPVEKRLEHKAGIEDIFPLLDCSAPFRQFSYEFTVQDDGKDLANYRTFAEEQVQNHFQFGAHLPYSPKQVRGMWLVLIFLTIFTLMPSFPILFVGRERPWFVYLEPLFMFLLFGSIVLFVSIRPLLKQHKAKKILRRFGKK